MGVDGVKEAEQGLMIFFWVNGSTTYMLTDKRRDTQTQTASRQTHTHTHTPLQSGSLGLSPHNDPLSSSAAAG